MCIGDKDMPKREDIDKEKVKDEFSWNYRVYRYKDGSLGVHETYYNLDQEGDITQAQDSVIGGSETIEDLLENLEQIKDDILKCKDDILDWEDEKE